MDITKYKELLLAERANIAEMDEISAEARETVTLDQQSVGRLSRMDALQGQAMNNAIAVRRQQAITRIDAALARMSEDEYGYCISCGDEMDEKRLKLDPAVSQCTLCASGNSA